MATKTEKEKKGEKEKSDLKGDPLENFQALALSSQGAALVFVIGQVLKHPSIFVFGEILNAPNVIALAQTAIHRPHLELLKIFAYGTYQDYVAQKDQLQLPKFDAATREIIKLKMLSIVEYASRIKLLQYRQLMADLDVATVRELEDLIIDCVYNGLIQGKLDQRKNAFEVQWVMGRDLGPTDVEDMAKTLDLWVNTSEALMKTLDLKLKQANEAHERKKKDQADIQKQRADIIEAIKVEVTQAGPDALANLLGQPGMRGDEGRSKRARGGQGGGNNPLMGAVGAMRKMLGGGRRA